MARYTPKKPISIASSCTEDWDSMQGDARVRHCAACDHDVHNTAAMTPAQIEAMLAGDGPLPCLRLAQFADGSLLVAEELRLLPRFGAMAGAAMAALVSISAASAGAQANKSQLVMGRKPMPQAIYFGTVMGVDGKPAPSSHVYVSRMVAGKQERVEAVADGQGSFRLQAAPGEWKVGAIGVNGPAFAQERGVTLHPGEQSATMPLLLEHVYVTAGIPPPPPTRVKSGK